MGALRDIKRDMAARRNSLLKQLVAEIEARVFVAVSDARRGGGAASSSAAGDDVDGDDGADEAGSGGSLSPSARPLNPKVLFNVFILVVHHEATILASHMGTLGSFYHGCCIADLLHGFRVPIRS